MAQCRKPLPCSEGRSPNAAATKPSRQQGEQGTLGVFIREQRPPTVGFGLQNKSRSCSLRELGGDALPLNPTHAGERACVGGLGQVCPGMVPPAFPGNGSVALPWAPPGLHLDGHGSRSSAQTPKASSSGQRLGGRCSPCAHTLGFFSACFRLLFFPLILAKAPDH